MTIPNRAVLAALTRKLSRQMAIRRSAKAHSSAGAYPSELAAVAHLTISSARRLWKECSVAVGRGLRGRPILSRLGLCIVLALVVGGCSSPSKPSHSTPAAASSTHGALSKVASIAALVPAAIRRQGFVKVATEDFPPATYQATNGQLTGWEVELGHDLGIILGVPFQFHLIQFAEIIPGLQSGQYNLGMGDIAVTTAREKIVDMVSTHEANEVFMALSSSGLRPSGLPGLCGLKVALLIGGVEVGEVAAAEPKCAQAGKKPIDVRQYESQPQVNLALASGRAQIEATASDFVAYVLSQTHGQFKIIGHYGSNALTGIAISRNAASAQFAIALRRAVQYLIKIGVYKQIFNRFNSGIGLLPSSLVQVNPQKTTFSG